MLNRCPTCQEIIWQSAVTHSCSPGFWVISPDLDGYDEPEECERITYAVDHEQAAETWAQRYDSDSSEYSIVSGSEAEVVVKSVADGSVKHFSVSGEPVPTYRATETTPEEKSPDAAG